MKKVDELCVRFLCTEKASCDWTMKVMVELEMLFMLVALRLYAHAKSMAAETPLKDLT